MTTNTNITDKQAKKLVEALELSVRALKRVKKNFDDNNDLHFVDEIIIDTALKAYDDYHESLKQANEVSGEIITAEGFLINKLGWAFEEDRPVTVSMGAVVDIINDYASLLTSKQQEKIEELNAIIERKHGEWENQRKVISEFHSVYMKHFGLNDLACSEELDKQIQTLSDTIKRLEETLKLSDEIINDCNKYVGANLTNNEIEKYFKMRNS